jgi:hypothetical protein
MARRPRNDGKAWTTAELRRLKRLAKGETADRAAKLLRRTPAATQQKAMRSGISFRGGH